MINGGEKKNRPVILWSRFVARIRQPSLCNIIYKYGNTNNARGICGRSSRRRRRVSKRFCPVSAQINTRRTSVVCDGASYESGKTRGKNRRSPSTRSFPVPPRWQFENDNFVWIPWQTFNLLTKRLHFFFFYRFWTVNRFFHSFSRNRDHTQMQIWIIRAVANTGILLVQ